MCGGALGLHIDPELHCKLQYVARYDGRSISGEVLYLLRRYIQEFEKEQCRIEIPQTKEQTGCLHIFPNPMRRPWILSLPQA